MDLTGMKAVVIGGATGGAASALLLARAGATVTVVERVPVLRAVGAGIAIAANGEAVLRGLGVDVEAVAERVESGRVVDGAGRTLIAPAANVLLARRTDLQGLLVDAMEREPRISLRLGTELENVDANGRIEVVRGGRTERLEADLVVGADGARSRVRSSGAFGARMSKTGIAYFRGLVPQTIARAEEAWTAAGLFGSFAVPGGTYFYGSASTRAARRAIEARDIDALRSLFRRAYPASAPLLDALARVEVRGGTAVMCVDCARFVDGRLVLVGDAAHAMPPNLGQGANSALVDAAVLVSELRSASSLDEGLHAYDARRRPAVRKVAAAAARLGAIAEWTSAPLRWLRDRVIIPLAARKVDGETIQMVMQESPTALASMAVA